METTFRLNHDVRDRLAKLKVYLGVSRFIFLWDKVSVAGP